MSVDEKLRSHGFHSAARAFDEATEHLRKRKNGEITPFATGWDQLNALLGGGIQPSTIYTVGGRPGVGKSSFVNRLLFDLCKLNDITRTVICYWTWEMPAYQQVIRGFSGKFGYTVQELMSAGSPLDDQLFQRILASRQQWADYPLYFMSYSRTPDQIYKICEQVQGLDPGLRVLNIFDHTRLARKAQGMFNEEEKITRLYHAAQQLSVNYGMVNIFLSQLNRDIESTARRTRPVPQLSDFFGADSVAQFSNVVTALQRPEQYRLQQYLGETAEGLLALHVLKNRDGEVSWLAFDHDLAHNTMKERYVITSTPSYQM